MDVCDCPDNLGEHACFGDDTHHREIGPFSGNSSGNDESACTAYEKFECAQHYLIYISLVKLSLPRKLTNLRACCLSSHSKSS